MDLNKLIPKDKFDIETALELSKYDFEIIKPISKELLSWLEDLHWPVSSFIANYLRPYTNELIDEILIIFKSDDLGCIYNIIYLLMFEVEYKLDERLIKELIRLRDEPTIYEKYDRLDEIAVKVINKQKSVVFQN